MAKTVLVVDDEPFIVKMVESRLKSVGYQVVTATSGEEGLRKCRFYKPDIVILDIMMPGLSGDAVAAAMSDDPAMCHIPIVFLTAILQKGEEPKASSGESQYYLAKPFDGKKLVEMLQKILSTR
jgi:CheY-like chemotaxis protein